MPEKHLLEGLRRVIREAAGMPDLRRGYCLPGNAVLDPGAWTARSPRQRAEAARECRRCSVLIACQAWAVRLQWANVVIAGLDFADQKRARNAAGRIRQRLARSELPEDMTEPGRP